jgi:D-glycero-D-manno-heptose 1,7-bisphosphate phosphatase
VTPLRRAVFLDRDGVLNDVILRDGKPASPAGPQEVRIPDGAAGALHTLRQAGFALICVTNQPDVARGIQRREVVEAINDALQAVLPLEEFFVCYHDDADGCSCRKPQPGLLLRAAAAHGIDLPGSFMIGDRWRDVEAGHRAGCRTIQLATKYAAQVPEIPPDYTAQSLADAASWILRQIASARRAV